MNIGVIEECALRSLAGTIGFSEVVERLSGAGVERYRTDLMRLEKCHYSSEGRWIVTPMAVNWRVPVADTFSAEAVRHVLNDVRSGRIDYQEFLKRIMRAGCCCYSLFLRGKRMVFKGRTGECYVELLPSDQN